MRLRNSLPTAVKSLARVREKPRGLTQRASRPRAATIGSAVLGRPGRLALRRATSSVARLSGFTKKAMLVASDT
ncbi:MAG: hypothetical protein ACRDSJ_05680, partial [Rubrobacteraceae bacterium]